MTHGSNGLRAPARLFIGAVVAAAVGLTVYYATSPSIALPRHQVGTLELATAYLLSIAIALLSELRPIQIPSTRMFDDGGDEWSVASAVYIADLLLFGPLFSIFVVGVAMSLSSILMRKSLAKIAFNTGQCMVTVGASGLILAHGVAGDRSVQHLLNSVEAFTAVSVALLVFFLLNTALVAGIIATADRLQFISVWNSLVRHGLTQYGTSLVIGLIATVLWSVSPVTIVLLVLPLVMVHVAFKAITQLRHETGQALLAIAEMVDARDSYAYHHSQEVARYATRVATQMGLPIEEVQTIKMAAQLHDIGKMGTPDRVLHKPGPLTPEEREVMERHSVAGAEVLKYFSLFREGADLALYHHEHYNGTGYPKGLAGEEIPLGARIIHVVDAYQAMTSDRVYRKALSVDEAVRRLLADSGKQFDPMVIKAFMEVLKDMNVIPRELPVPEVEKVPSLVPSRS